MAIAFIAGDIPEVNPDGRVALLHAGVAAQVAIDTALDHVTGDISPEPRGVAVPELLAKLAGFHRDYLANIFPDLGDAFDLALFNSYRAALYPGGFPSKLGRVTSL